MHSISSKKKIFFFLRGGFSLNLLAWRRVKKVFLFSFKLCFVLFVESFFFFF